MVNIHFYIDDFYNEFKKQLVDNPNPVNVLENTISSLGKEYLLPVTEVILSGWPLASMQASGKFRDYIFVTRNGKTYIKKYTKPKEPNKPKQRAQQSRFGQAVKSWKDLSDEQKAEYNRRADIGPEPLQGINIYVREQLKKS